MTDRPSEAKPGGLARRGPGTVVLACLGVLAFLTGCGSSNSPATNNPSPPGNVSTTANPSGSGSGSTTACTIPQGNGGDHDSDNNGGPDDGDGCDR